MEHALNKTGRKDTSANGQYLLFVGRTSAHKNLEGVLRGFERLHGALPHKLVVVGVNGGKDDHPHLQYQITSILRVMFQNQEKIRALSKRSTARIHLSS